MDLDAGMSAEGRRAAEDNEVMNIRWVQGLAEDLPAVAPGPWNISRAA
jgi:ubiquinone/menaquinone biosynthesis C-methylase UbiE